MLFPLLTAAGLFFVGLAAFGGGKIFPQQSFPALGRLEAYLESYAGGEPTLSDPVPSLGPLGRLGRRYAQWRNARPTAATTGTRSGQLAFELERADLNLRPDEWVAIQGATGLGVALIVTWRLGIIPGLIAGVLAGWFATGWLVSYRQRRRLGQFNSQLADTIVLLANGLRAGHSLAGAMQSVVETSEAPMSVELGRAGREMELGLPLDQALTRIMERNPSPDFYLLVSAVQIHRTVGGNLAAFFDTIAETIRERVRIQDEVRTLTAQARLSGWIISGLPIALAFLLNMIAPDYFSPMLKNTFGIVLFVIGGFSMLVGIGLIRRIVKVDY